MKDIVRLVKVDEMYNNWMIKIFAGALLYLGCT